MNQIINGRKGEVYLAEKSQNNKYLHNKWILNRGIEKQKKIQYT